MAIPRGRIRKFFEAAISRQEEATFTLFHVLVNGKKNPCWTSEKNMTIDDLLSSVCDTAQGMAEGSPTAVKLNLQATDPAYDGKVIGTVWFVAEPTATSDEEGRELSEPADRDGLLAMLMRHNSDLHRQSSGMWGVMFQYMTQIINRQSEQLEKLQTEKMQAAETMEALISKKHQRDMESKQIEADMKRKDEMFGKIMLLLPVVVNKIAGKEIVRQNDTAFEITTSEFLKTITSDKIEALMNTGVFDKHQMTLLITMLEQLTKRMLPAEERQKSPEISSKAIFGSLGSALSNLVTTGTSS